MNHLEINIHPTPTKPRQDKPCQPFGDDVQSSSNLSLIDGRPRWWRCTPFAFGEEIRHPRIATSMKTIQFLVATLIMSMLTLRAAGEVSIETCPPIGWNFKILPYLNAARSLQEEGSEKAVLRLRSWAKTGKHEHQVVILCRMLFEAKKGRGFRGPMIGEAAFFGGTHHPDWPLEPIEIYESVPILITQGYRLFGLPESSDRYLDFCIKNCEWRQTRYPVRSHDELKGVVARWLTSRKWPVGLSVRDQTFFTKQAD